MSDVYDVQLVHSVPPGRYNITAAAAYSSTLILGCDDGAVRLVNSSAGMNIAAEI
jgi:hypothetical protein